MKFFYWFLMVCGCCLSGCLSHSVGPKSITPAGFSPGLELKTGKNIYVAVLKPLPADISESPEYITTQFAKSISMISEESFPGPAVESLSEAVEAARNHGSDYVVLLNVARWKQGSLLSVSHKVKMDVSVYEADTSRMLRDDAIEAVCHLMLVGLEQSLRECVRPQIDIWIHEAFHTDVQTPANTIPIRQFSTPSSGF